MANSTYRIQYYEQNEKSQEPSIEKFEHPRTKQKIDFEDDLKNKELLNI